MFKMFSKKKKNIEILLIVERRASAESEPYLQKIKYTTQNSNATVATMLNELNLGDYEDEKGKQISPIKWQCSCLQKKCGACAMVVNGKPQLACDCFLRDYKKNIKLKPLKKFPVIADLIVDRERLFENLKTMEVWIDGNAMIEDKDREILYDSTHCLQCGCCLEVCPNFANDKDFFGAAAFVPTTGVLASISKEQKEDLLNSYNKHIYDGCGKSLACNAICPAGIDIENMLLHSNKISVWKNKKKKKH